MCSGGISHRHQSLHCLCVFWPGIPLGQASILLVAFISFFLVAAVFNGEYGDKAIDDERTY